MMGCGVYMRKDFNSKKRSDRGAALVDTTLLLVCSLSLVIAATETLGWGLSWKFERVAMALSGGGTDIIIMVNPNNPGGIDNGGSKGPNGNPAVSVLE